MALGLNGGGAVLRSIKQRGGGVLGWAKQRGGQVLGWAKQRGGRVLSWVERRGDEALQWCADRIGILFVLALGLFLVVVVVCGALWHWAGWDRETDLAVAEILIPLAFAGFGLVVVSAAVRAFRPLRPVLGFSLLKHPKTGQTLFIVENSGRVAASDVQVEIVADRSHLLELVGPSWELDSEGDPLHSVLLLYTVSPPNLGHTVFRRSGSLRPSGGEIVFAGYPDSTKEVRITASNADEVHCHPQASPPRWRQALPPPPPPQASPPPRGPPNCAEGPIFDADHGRRRPPRHCPPARHSRYSRRKGSAPCRPTPRK